MSNIIDPNTINLVLSGQSAFGSGGGMPVEGLHAVVVTESSVRQNEHGVSLWITMTLSSGYKLYDYVALPTAESARQQTKYGTKAEFFEKKLKGVLQALGHDVPAIKALTGNGYTGQHVIDWTLNRPGNVYYRPPVNGGKHQIDYVSTDKVELVKSGDVTFADRRNGGVAAAPAPMAPTVMLTPQPVSNGLTTPQPPVSVGIPSAVDTLVGL